ncbi:MAG: adenosylcobinamide-GDP ribazoletransferase [Desulforhabdus sp.]|jgi:adenosylcobinamide-GDP ribazoletransferase|nr:adenosylcobinamide-GDP ribazoletransferase [Desulforhabdus sp.]
MKGFIAAIRFLTIVPFFRTIKTSEEDLVRSMAFYPLAGFIIGIYLVVIRIFFGLFFSSSLTDIIVIISLVIVTGALHLDGLADTADGLAGGRNKEKVLAIMKDTKIGSFGVAGIVGVIILKISALGEIPEFTKASALIAMPVLSRWSVVQIAACLPYARPGDGTGKIFVCRSGLLESFVSSMTAILIVAGLFLIQGFLIMILIAGMTVIMGLFFFKWIGGVTGDSLGAAIELNEIAVLLAVAVLF